MSPNTRSQERYMRSAAKKHPTTFIDLQSVPKKPKKTKASMNKKQEKTEDEFSVVPDRPLWIRIGMFLPYDEANELFPNLPGLEGIEKIVEARQVSNNAIRFDVIRCGEDKDSEGNLDPVSKLVVEEDELWFSWGADKAGFNTVKTFKKFLRQAGVSDDEPIVWSSSPYSKHYNWISDDKKFIVITSSNPLEDGYCHYFGVTGLRSISWPLFLKCKESKEFRCDEICWNGRDFI